MIAAPSSTVPRPRSRMPPAPSSMIERNRCRWAARSCRSSSFSALRSAASGSATSTRCLAALARSVAFSRVAARAGTPPRPPAPPRRWGAVSTASTITAACSGDTRPEAIAACVAVRSPPAPPACRTVWWPVDAVGAGQVGEPLRGRPPRQLALRDPAGVHLGQRPRPRPRPGARAAARPPPPRPPAPQTSWPPTSSRRDPRPAPVRAASTPAGVVGVPVGCSMTPLNQRPPTLRAPPDGLPTGPRSRNDNGWLPAVELHISTLASRARSTGSRPGDRAGGGRGRLRGRLCAPPAPRGPAPPPTGRSAQSMIVTPASSSCGSGRRIPSATWMVRHAGIREDLVTRRPRHLPKTIGGLETYWVCPYCTGRARRHRAGHVVPK